VGRKHTPESRRKISAAMRGRKVAPDVVARRAAAQRGRKRSPETRAKIAASLCKGDDIGYSAAHFRVRQLRGPAAAHACAACGDPACEWAFDHSTPVEDTRYHADGRPYSPRVEAYRPLCISCHRQDDKRAKRVRVEVA